MVWSTEQELWFLERLGLHKFVSTQWPKEAELFNPAERIKALEVYRDSMSVRENWFCTRTNAIRKDILLEYIQYELERIRESGTSFDFDTYEKQSDDDFNY